MKIKVTIPSSCEGSLTKLIITNVEESCSELLLTIDAVSGMQDIYITKENLKNALLGLMPNA